MPPTEGFGGVGSSQIQLDENRTDAVRQGDVVVGESVNHPAVIRRHADAGFDLRRGEEQVGEGDVIEITHRFGTNLGRVTVGGINVIIDDEDVLAADFPTQSIGAFQS